MTIVAMVLAVTGMGISVAGTSATVGAVDSAVSELDDALDATDEFPLDFGTPAVSYGTTEVPVTVTNTTDETQTCVITIVAERPDGTTQIDSASVVVNDLAGGQTASETASFTEELPADAQLRVSERLDQSDYSQSSQMPLSGRVMWHPVQIRSFSSGRGVDSPRGWNVDNPTPRRLGFGRSSGSKPRRNSMYPGAIVIAFVSRLLRQSMYPPLGRSKHETAATRSSSCSIRWTSAWDQFGLGIPSFVPGRNWRPTLDV